MQSNPWFSIPETGKKNQHIAIVGAGVAGCSLAHRLHKEGHKITLLDRNDNVAQEGSGNRIGLIKPRLDLDGRGFGAFNRLGYLHSVDFYDDLEKQGQAIWVGKRGLFEMAEDVGDELRQKLLVKKEILPSNEMYLLSASQASARLGVKVERGGLWYVRSGCVSPVALCESLIKGIEVQYSQNIRSVERSGQYWQLKTCEGRVFEADTVVFTTAGETQALNKWCDLHFEGRRGQVNYVEATPQSHQLKHAMSCAGYLTPDLFEHEGTVCHLVGASFEKWSDFSDKSYETLQEESEAKNRVKLERFFPKYDLKITGGRVGMRAMTLDHLPMVGPLYKDKTYTKMYQRLCHGPRAQLFEKACYVEGLYIMAGLGARGLQTAPLLAEVLTSYISGTEFCVEEQVREALHPARFKIRALKRGKI